MKLSLHLVTYNGAKYLPYLFESLRTQTFQDWEMIVVENGSSDETLQVAKKEVESLGRPHRLLVNTENKGFTGGHNQAFNLKAQTSSLPSRMEGSRLAPYVCLVNQDMMLAPDYLERLMEFMEGNPEAAAAQGALFRWNFGPSTGGEQSRTTSSGRLQAEFSEIIDSLGLRVSKSRHVSDWGSGQSYGKIARGSDALAHVHPVEIFGVSGALPLYRRQALEVIALGGEIFDEDFFSYKEDVDLAFRLRSAGWRAYLIPAARAWHDRTVSGKLDRNIISLIRGRRGRSFLVAGWAYRNHLFTLIKNEYFANVWRDSARLFFYELRKFAFLALFTPRALFVIPLLLRLAPRMLRKRVQIRRKRKIFAWEMRRWFI